MAETLVSKMAPTDRLSELQERARAGIGNVSSTLAPNYTAADLEPDPHAHDTMTSVRRVTHRG